MNKKKRQIYLTPGNEYYEIVKEILDNKEFQKRKEYMHHENSSVYDHSLSVSILLYIWAKKWHLDYKSAAIGGLLHDFYDKPWQSKEHKLESKTKKGFFKQHGFVHASEAARNAKLFFPHLINPKIDNIIRRHMFPLNIHPPKYIESWMITLVDKYVSLDVLKTPKAWPKYLGIGKKKGR